MRFKEGTEVFLRNADGAAKAMHSKSAGVDPPAHGPGTDVERAGNLSDGEKDRKCRLRRAGGAH